MKRGRYLGRRYAGASSAWLLISALGCDAVETRTLRIAVYTFGNECGLGLSEAEDTELSLTALGDYGVAEPLAVPLEHAPRELQIPEGTRAIRAELQRGGATFVGYAEQAAGLDWPILLWPVGRGCRLSGADGEYPANGGGQGLGYNAASRRLLLAGGDDPNQMSKSVETLSFDVGTGARERGTLSEPRAYASVTAFGQGFLIAGGEDPWNSEGRVIEPSATAEIPADSATGAVTSIDLGLARTRHAGYVLPNGDTLLLGGLDQFSRAPNLLEAIDHESRRRDVGFPALQVPRLFPNLLGLHDGRLFVGGGTAADGSPLSALEWLSGDARERLGLSTPEELPARQDRAFAAMPGGGVLLVGGCSPRIPEPGEDCSMCRAGCPPRDRAGNPDYDAWWLLPEGTPLRLERLGPHAPRPVLLGSSGRPLLAPGEGGELYRFDPWSEEFQEESGLEIECPPAAGLSALALDESTFAWVSDAGCALGPALFGLRTGVNERYTGTHGLVPDRPPRGDAEYAAGELRFTRGSAVRVYFEGAYDDFVLSFERDPALAAPKLVILSAEGAGATLVDVGPSELVRVERSGRVLSGSDGLRAEVPPGRLRIGFAAGSGETRVRAIALTPAY